MATMTMETATGARASVLLVTETTCLCGQALELCHAAHCPRCGTTLHH
ncbi:MAG: hypothetical protein JWR90_78 [Marmoricola sp.]|jgi:hypothetical protein|nr:hypothetical protein [Marmoricola sp.]